MKKKSTRRGGWPKRDVSRFLLRLEPSVASRLAELAAECGVSRNNFIELWLRAIVSHADLARELGSAGPSLMGEFIRLGLEGVKSRKAKGKS